MSNGTAPRATSSSTTPAGKSAPSKAGQSRRQRKPGSGDPRPAHVRNFLDCVKSRQQPVLNLEIGHRVSTLAHLGNIAYRTGHKIVWDAARESRRRRRGRQVGRREISRAVETALRAAGLAYGVSLLWLAYFTDRRYLLEALPVGTIRAGGTSGSPDYGSRSLQTRRGRRRNSAHNCLHGGSPGNWRTARCHPSSPGTRRRQWSAHVHR